MFIYKLPLSCRHGVCQNNGVTASPGTQNPAKNQGWKIMEWKDEGAMFAQKTTSNQGFHRTLGKVEQEGVILNLGPIGQF